MSSLHQQPVESKAEEVLWQDLTAIDAADFSARWLALLCRQIPDVTTALMLQAEDSSGPFRLVARWPGGNKQADHLASIAERALRERRGVTETVRGAIGEEAATAYPVEVNDQLTGVVALGLRSADADRVQQALRQLHWAMAWPELHQMRRMWSHSEAARERVFGIVDLAARVVEAQDFQTAAYAVVSELATRLQCARVSLGLRRGNGMRVRAVSHSAGFAREMNLMRALAEAMDEAADEQRVIHFPPSREEPDSATARPPISRAHEQLARSEGARHSLSVPIFRDDRVDAVFTLERDQAPFDVTEQDYAQAATGLAGGMLLHRAAEEQWFTARLREKIAAISKPIWGEGHAGVKLGVLLLVLAVGALSLVTGPFRVHAPTTVEGGQLRAMAAPFSGYLARAEARAGDSVQSGQLLAALDDHDLRLERIQPGTELPRFERELQQAAADRDRAKGRILDAQLKQAQARLRLINVQLERSRLLAPFDGLIVSGDLSHSLGKPVERGEVLFELSPQGEFRLALQLDERDVRFVEAGQSGTLLLGALPNQPIEFQVSRITPMTESGDGRTFYRAEGRLEGVSGQLHPGMEGIGKIHIGEAKLVWQWSRGLLHWLRTWLWSWSP